MTDIQTQIAPFDPAKPGQAVNERLHKVRRGRRVADQEQRDAPEPLLRHDQPRQRGRDGDGVK